MGCSTREGLQSNSKPKKQQTGKEEIKGLYFTTSCGVVGQHGGPVRSYSTVTMTVHECSCAMGHRYCTLVLWLIGPLQRTSGSAGSINSPGIQWIGRTNEALLFKHSSLHLSRCISSPNWERDLIFLPDLTYLQYHDC